MSSTDKGPSYSAVLRHPDTDEDLGPVSVDGAWSEAEAVQLAKANAPARVQEEGLSRAFVQVSRNGYSLGRFEVNA